MYNCFTILQTQKTVEHRVFISALRSPKIDLDIFIYDTISGKFENIFMIHISIKWQKNACLKHLHQHHESLLPKCSLLL